MAARIGKGKTSLELLIMKIKVDKNGCWIFQTKPNNSGYCYFWMNGEHIGAHRASWIIFKGPIPDGLCVLHKCDVGRCVNPEHLFVGTRKDNSRDAENKGRLKHPGQSHKTHCKWGHKFSKSNTYLEISSSGSRHRSCRKCHIEHQRRRRVAASLLEHKEAPREP